ASGETEERTIWFRVTAWGRQAELAAEYLAKGRQVYVEGRLRREEYTDREGVQRVSLEVNASDIQFLGQRAEPAERSEEIDQIDEETEKEKGSKPAASRNGKRAISKRAPAREAGGIEDDEVPF